MPACRHSPNAQPCLGHSRHRPSRAGSVLLIDDDDRLPSKPTEEEAKRVAELGEAGVHTIDVTLQKKAISMRLLEEAG
jgi:hypothetical protein